MTGDLAVLRSAIPYIRAYKNTTFVVKLSGGLCTPGTTLDNVAEQIVFLHQLGIRIVVVHGGGQQATALAARLGIESPFVNGRRVTSPEMLEVGKMAFAGTVNTDLVAALGKAGAIAVGLTGADGHTVLADKRPVSEVDYGFVGDVRSVDTSLLDTLLSAESIPVICSLAAGTLGEILNVNADVLASRVAVAVGAAKLCLLTGVDGVMRDVTDPGSLVVMLKAEEAERLLDAEAVSGGMLPKLRASLDALHGGVPRVHIINGAKRDTLLREILTNEGAGTMITDGG